MDTDTEHRISISTTTVVNRKWPLMHGKGNTGVRGFYFPCGLQFVSDFISSIFQVWPFNFSLTQKIHDFSENTAVKDSRLVKLLSEVSVTSSEPLLTKVWLPSRLILNAYLLKYLKLWGFSGECLLTYFQQILFKQTLSFFPQSGSL